MSARVIDWRSPSGQSVEVVLGGGHAVGDVDRFGSTSSGCRAPRSAVVVVHDAEALLDRGDDGVGRSLVRLGHHQLGAVPRVRDLGLGQLRRQLGLLVERPRD